MNRHRIATAALAALTPAAAAQVEYRLVIIEPWNTQYALRTSSAAGLNNLNQVTGCATTEPLNSGPCSFLWTLQTGKQPINVAGPINDRGFIAISNYLRWPDGTLQEMSGPMGGAADLNNANVVAGSDGSVHTCPVPPPFVNREATVWSPSGGTVLVEQQLGVRSADQAWGINESDEIVGVKSDTGHCGDQKAFYYNLQTNEYIDLHTLFTGMSSGITHAFDINDSGVVVGDGPHGGTVKPFLWSRRGGFTILPPAPGSVWMDTHFESINNRPQAVGGAIVNDLEWHAIIWDEVNGVRDLNDLAEVPPNFTVDGAREINDNGWIIASGHYGTWSPERAVVLIPIETCYPDCDTSTGRGILDVFDFLCFQNRYAAGSPYACDCDTSTGPGLCDIFDFLCFQNEFAVGCQ